MPACALPSALLLLQNVVRMVRQIHKDRTNLRRGLRGTHNILKVRPSLPCARLLCAPAGALPPGLIPLNP